MSSATSADFAAIRVSPQVAVAFSPIEYATSSDRFRTNTAARHAYFTRVYAVARVA